MKCPHCQQQIAKPPAEWPNGHVWNCSHCGGLYALDSNGPYRIPPNTKPLTPLLSHSIAERWCFFAHESNAYTYALCYPNGLPFYVGSGVRDRALQHAIEAERFPAEKQQLKHKTIWDIWEQNQPLWYCFLGFFRDRQEAIVLENYYIDLWGLRSTGGMLTNRVGPRKTSADFPLDHVQPPPLTPEQLAAQRNGITVFLPGFYVAPPVYGKEPRFETARCPACNCQGALPDSLYALKLMCSKCGHFFFPYKPNEYDDGKSRAFYAGSGGT